MLKILIPTTGIRAFRQTLRSLILAHSYRRDVMLITCVNTPFREAAFWARDYAACTALSFGWEHRTLVIRDNIGYVKAMNLAWQVADVQDEDIVVALNDDVIFRGDCLGPMAQKLDQYPGGIQIGPSAHYVGRDGLWGIGGERYRYCEGWFWMAPGWLLKEAQGVQPHPRTLVQPYKGSLRLYIPHLYDPDYSPAYCEDMDLSIRIQEAGGHIDAMSLPVKHLRSQTYGGRREPFWTANRLRLVRSWTL